MPQLAERLEVAELGDGVVRQHERLEVGHGEVDGGGDGVYPVVRQEERM